MSIDYAELKEHIYDYISDLGITIRGNKTLSECPVCHGGTKTHNSAIQPSKLSLKCFSCGFYGDIVDLYMEIEKTTDRKESVKKLSERYGNGGNRTAYKKSSVTQTPTEPKPQQDFTEYIMKCASEPQAPDYFLSRGISSEVVKRFNLGLDKVEQRAIIPYNRYLYIGRDITGKSPVKYKRAKGVEKTEPFNASRLLEDTERPLWVVEGEINALSVESLSLQAIGIGSANDYVRLIDYIKRHGTKRKLIVCLDEDEAGRTAASKLSEELFRIYIPHCCTSLPVVDGDINDTLITNKKGLKNCMIYTENKFMEGLNQVEQPVKTVQQQFNNELNDGLIESPLKEYSGLSALDSLLGRIKNPDFTPTPTGFDLLDKKLGGGLYSGLVTIMAAPSEGKTTFAMQMGETIAERDERELVVFSFEMSKEQLTAKTISRLTYEASYQSSEESLTAIEFMQSYKPESKLSGAQIKHRETALKRYTDSIGSYITIIDDCEPTTDGILYKLAEWEKFSPVKKKAPVIIVDYLQLLNSGEKEFLNGCKDITLALKQYAIKNDTLVFAISSVNRESQRNGTSLTSAYGSSFAEYSSDYMFTLDFTAIKKGYSDTNKEQLKQKPIREMSVTIQKNRMGLTGETIDFKYSAAYNHFKNTKSIEEASADFKKESERKGGVIK